MTEPGKDTIYVDVDDEITGIIDKLRSSDGKVLALVLPKRASVLQSIVNMKLLKRTADEAKKHLVLITTEAGLLPLAGAVGLHVAKTLTSRPEIPAAPDMDGPAEERVDEDLALPDKSRPVGELAGAATMPIPEAGDDAVETLQMEDDDEPEKAATAAKPKVKKDKKLAVPSFDRFRLWLLLGGLLLIILVVFGYLAISVLPKATISIKTDASNVNTSVDMTLDTTATALNAANKTVPAKQATEQKTYTGTSTTTGQKNNGQKATGQVTISLANCNENTVTIPAGSFVSDGSMSYITGSSATLSSVTVAGHCNPSAYSNIYSQTVPVTASKAGVAYNISSGTAMTVGGGSGYTASDLKASANGDIGGGTDSIVQVVSQADIASATAKIATQDASVKQDLQNQLQTQNLYAITTTFSNGTPATTNSANVGDAANTVTVTEVVTSTMLGASQANLKTLVDNDIKSQIDTSKQGILNEGIGQTGFKVTSATANGAAITLQTTAEVGPNINIATIKQQAAGKKVGDIESAIKNDPDVTDVKAHFSPFWVTTAPKKVSKITVTVAKPTTTASKHD